MNVDPNLIAQIQNAIRTQKEYKHDATPAIVVRVNNIYGFYFDSKPRVGDVIRNGHNESTVVARITFANTTTRVDIESRYYI